MWKFNELFIIRFHLQSLVFNTKIHILVSKVALKSSIDSFQPLKGKIRKFLMNNIYQILYSSHLVSDNIHLA